MPRAGRPAIYRKSITALSAKLFNAPQPSFEPYTFLVIDNHHKLPFEKNRLKNPYYYNPENWNTRRVLQYLNEKNLFVDEAWRYKMQMWRMRYIKGKQPSWSRVKWTDLTEQEKQMKATQDRVQSMRRG